jgi:hypothetical protein
MDWAPDLAHTVAWCICTAAGGAVMVYEINEVNDRPVEKPQEKVLMNIAASFPSVKKPRYVDQEKSRQYD